MKNKIGKSIFNLNLLVISFLISSCSAIIDVNTIKKFASTDNGKAGILIVEDGLIEAPLNFVIDPANPPDLFLSYSTACSFKVSKNASEVPCSNYGDNLPSIDTINEKITWIVSGNTPKGIYNFTIQKKFNNVTLVDTVSWDVNISTPFITKWNLTANKPFKIKLNKDYTYNFLINWGDGNPSQHITNSSDLSHDFDPSLTTTTITIHGEFPGFGKTNIEPNNRTNLIHIYTDFANEMMGGGYTYQMVEDMLTASNITTPELYQMILANVRFSPFNQALTEVSNLGSVGWKNLDNAFTNQPLLTSVSGGDLSQVTSMKNTFDQLNSITMKLNSSSWNLANVVNATALFKNVSFTNDSDLSGITFSNKLTEAAELFAYTRSDLNSLPNTLSFSGLKNISGAFQYAQVSNLNTVMWSLNEVENFNNTFLEFQCTNCDLSGIKMTSKTTSAIATFHNAKGMTNLNTNSWNTLNIQSMERMFKVMDLDGIDLSGIVVSNKNTNLQDMFYSASNMALDTTLPGRSWDTSSVVNMENLFRGATCKTISSCNFNRVIPSSATKFLSNAFVPKYEGVYNPNYDYVDVSNTPPIDTSLWDTSNVEEVAQIFAYKDLQGSNLSGFKISNKVTDITNLFQHAYNAVIDTSSWDTRNVKIANNAFENVDLSNSNLSGIVFTDQLTEAEMLFKESGTLTINTSSWDISNLVKAEYFFYEANFLNSNLSGFVPTLKMEKMNSAFYNVENAIIDTTNWKLSSTINIQALFAFGKNNTLILKNLDLASIPSAGSMFMGSFSNDTNIFIMGSTNEPSSTTGSHYVRPGGLEDGHLYCENLSTYLDMNCEAVP